MIISLVKQPEGSHLCGQACVAMIAGIPLRKSIEVFGKTGGTRAKDLIEALRTLGVSCGDKLIKINKKTSKPPICIVKLHFAGSKRTHWSVFYAGSYYDPVGRVFDYGYPDGVRVTSFLPIEEV